MDRNAAKHGQSALLHWVLKKTDLEPISFVDRVWVAPYNPPALPDGASIYLVPLALED